MHIKHCSIYKGITEIPEVGLIIDVNSKKITAEKYQIWEEDGVKSFLIKPDKKIKCISEVKMEDEKWDYQKLLGGFIILFKPELESFLEPEEIKKNFRAIKLLG